MKRLNSRVGKTRAAYTEGKENRRRRIIQIAVSLFLVFLLLFSYIAYYFTPDQSIIRENGFRIVQSVDANGFVTGYSTKVNGVERQFYTAPGDSLDITLPEGMIDELRSAPLVIVLFNPSDNLTPVYDQIRFDLSTNLNATIISAVTQPSAQYPSLTELSCENASVGVTTLYLGEGSRSIVRDGGCYALRGAQFDYGALRDRVLYRYHGITTQ